jgi:hypothetical protein
MNLPWIAMGVMFLLGFAVFETYAFRHPERQNTLSRAIYNLGRQWPFSIFLFGLVVGALATHFFWQWCPDGGTGVG